MNAPKIGLVYIGQAPRTDVTSSMRKVLGGKAELVEKGILDGMDAHAIAALRPSGKDLEFPLISRLADGAQCSLGKHNLMPLVEEVLRNLQQDGVNVAVLLCTSVFETVRFPQGMLVLEAGRIVDSWIAAMATPYRNLGLLVPLPEQEGSISAHYDHLGYQKKITASASPYGHIRHIADAAKAFEEVDFVVLHCMGFTLQHKEIVAQACKKPVLQATGILAHTVAEILC